MVLPRAWRPPAAAAALAVLTVAGAASAPPTGRPLDVAGGLLLVAMAAVTAGARRWPVPVLAVTATGALAYGLLGYPGYAPMFPLFAAIFTAMRAGHRAATAVAAVVTVAGGLSTAAGAEPAAAGAADARQRWILLIGWLLAAATAGELARKHGAYLDQVERRAEEAERTREETARRRADEERLRIARELHDSLTHCISIIKVQAGVAVHLARKRGEPVPEALLAIQQAGAEAMRELRSTLEVLRDDEAASSLDRVEQLAAGAGLPVTVRVEGARRALSPAVDRAAYRIIQEALTNVGRHAGPGALARVTLHFQDDDLTVRVDDDGHGAQPTGAPPGVGLLGMRERVAALGGALHTGPGADGGFTVRAHLPLHDARREPAEAPAELPSRRAGSSAAVA